MIVYQKIKLNFNPCPPNTVYKKALKSQDLLSFNGKNIFSVFYFKHEPKNRYKFEI